MKKSSIVLILILLIITSCKQNKSIYPKNGNNSDFDGEISEIKIQRLEEDLFSIPLDSISFAIPDLKLKYGEFFNLFNNYLIKIGGPENKAYPSYLKNFITDYTINLSYKKTKEVFPNVDDLNKKLNQAFKNYIHFFPGKSIPQVYTFISGFNESIVVTDSILAIGLDKYLGRDCDFYYRLMWPRYMVNNMHKDKIPSDCMNAWAETEFEYSDSIDNLINRMIYNGKIIYFTSCMLPNEPDSIRLGFTTNQLEFCKANEKRMWTFIVEQKLLFNTEAMTIRKFTDDGPFTTVFTKESPAKAANWIGYKIVSDYMKNTDEEDLLGLFAEQDFMKILKLSKYNPK